MHLIISSAAIFYSTMFFTSFFSKMLTLNEFQNSIIQFNIIPKSWSKKMGIMILSAEFLLAVFTSLFYKLEVAFALSALMLLLFTGVLLKAFLQNNEIACYCFGQSAKGPGVRGSLIRNSILILCAIFGMFITNGSNINNYSYLLEDWEGLPLSISVSMVYLFIQEHFLLHSKGI